MANIKISELNEATLPLDGTEDLPIVDAGVTKRCSTQDIADLAHEGKKYWRGLISQSGTGDPTAVVLENTLGGTLTFSRSSAGVYSIGSSALFTSGKTFVTPKWETLRQSTNYATVTAVYSNTSQIALNSYLNGSGADDLITSHPFEIIVYP